MKKVIWLGTSRKDMKEFPEDVQYGMGHALLQVQKGERPTHAKTLSGFGSASIVEIKERSLSGTYRTVYTIEKPEYVFVLHAFQKKSKSGIATPPKDIETIKRRIKEVDDAYAELKKEKKS